MEHPEKFFSNRGVPNEILYDNGSHFVSQETQSLFERLVRSTKRCLKKVLSNSRLTYGEMLTVLSEIKVILNNAHLTFLYDEVGE